MQLTYSIRDFVKALFTQFTLYEWFLTSLFIILLVTPTHSSWSMGRV